MVEPKWTTDKFYLINGRGSPVAVEVVDYGNVMVATAEADLVTDRLLLNTLEGHYPDRAWQVRLQGKRVDGYWRADGRLKA
jgi:hypothetical protein